MKYFLLLTLFLVSSCSSYVNSLHRQIDREERANKMAKQRTRYNPYATNQRGYYDRRPIKNPITLGGRQVDTSRMRQLSPQLERIYGTKRVTADDFKDKENDGNLWSGNNSESFLFVTNNIKRRGDIVIVEVLSSLKDKIQDELKRTFPDPGKKTAGAATPAPQPPQAPTAPGEKTDANKVYDKISTQVIEEVNKDYVLIRGRKEVMFKKNKRYVEFQALVARKDISSSDAVKSSKVLEPKVSVLRYQ